MVCLRRGFACWLVCMSSVSSFWPARADDSSFPFGSELMLDVEPMSSSKRVPMLEIDDDGTATIDLWCVSAQAQASVGDDTITFTPQPAQPNKCLPALLSADQDLLGALALVTKWRRDGEVIEFIGPTTLRFRLMTN